MTSRIIFSSRDFHCFTKKLPVGFPCLTCAQNCCTDYVIFISHLDFLRIHKALPGLPPLDYVGLAEVDADDYPGILIEGELRRLVLRKDRLSGRCVFLASGVNMCAIHEFSPYICQMYPFQVPYDDYQELELRLEVKCPTRFLCSPENIDPLISIARKFWTRELPDYIAQVERWNLTRPEGTLQEFLEFLISPVW